MNGSKIQMGRVFLCAVLLCVAVVLCFVVHVNGVDAIKDKLTELDRGNKGMDNIFWVVDEVMYLLPLALVATTCTVMYSKQREDRYARHREQGYSIIAMMAFMFLLFLPIISGISPDGNDGEAVSLLHKSVEWFIREGIFFIVLALYHFARAEATDEEEPEDEAEELDEEDDY